MRAVRLPSEPSENACVKRVEGRAGEIRGRRERVRGPAMRAVRKPSEPFKNAYVKRGEGRGGRNTRKKKGKRKRASDEGGAAAVRAVRKGLR